MALSIIATWGVLGKHSLMLVWCHHFLFSVGWKFLTFSLANSSAVNIFSVCFDIDRHSDSFSMMRMWDLLCETLYSNIYESLHSLSLSLLSVLIAVVLCIRWLAVKQMILCISFLLTLELKWLCLGPANWQKELQTKKELQRQTLVKWKIPGKARNQMDLWLEEIIAFRFCQVLVRCYPALA